MKKNWAAMLLEKEQISNYYN